MSQKTGVLEPELSIVGSATGRPERAEPVRFLPYGVALVVVTLTYWTIDIVSPALPSIKDDLALSAAGAGLVFSMLFFGRLLGNVPATMLLGRSGASLTAFIGSLVLAAGSGLAALAPSSEVLLVARVLQGAGISLVVNAGLQSILKSRPAEGAAMTWFGLAATVGGIFGLQSGGLLTDSLGWRSVFGWSSLLASGVAVVTLASVRVGRRPVVQNTDVPGELPRAIHDGGSLVGPLVLNFVVFVNYSIWVVLPLFVEQSFDASAEATANLLMVITVVHLLAAIPVSRLIQRAGSARVLVAGMVMTLSGTALVLASPSLVWMSVPLVVYGVGQVAAVNAGGDIVLRRGAGSSRAIGLVRLSSDLGLVIGPIVAGAMQDVFGYGAPFAVLPVLTGCSIAAAVFLLLRRD
jgi:MFS family permease